jgi:hypothetical protein
MTDYVVAYANESTDFEWLLISAHYNFQFAVNHINAILPEMTNSSLAIFTRRETDTSHWSTRRPRRIYNRHIINAGLNPNGLISPALSGIINSRESDWF